MATVLHVLVDASAGMAAVGKLRQCLTAVSAIRRSGAEGCGLYPHLPPVQVWRFSHEVSTPFRPRLPAGGTACLGALAAWLEERQAGSPEADATPVLILSDGLFEDAETLERLSTRVRECAALRVAVAGVGPDRDMGALARLSSSGTVWTLGELGGALWELLGPPPPDVSMEEALAPLLDGDDAEELG